MKKIINKKIYDTDKAILVAEYSNGLFLGDFNYIYEELYLTDTGQFFLHAQGGPNTKYSESNGNQTSGIETIILLDSVEAYAWLEKHNKIPEIMKYFLERVQEG
ncbi:hypothetical protein [Oceanobacillus sp. CAU 1775]